MKYLLDVSSLIALGIIRHEFHGRMVAWLDSQRGSSFLTCSITELGFIRIVAQQPIYGYTVSQACTVLLELKKDVTFPFEFISDEHDIAHLPAWVRTARQTTDGHLLELANGR